MFDLRADSSTEMFFSTRIDSRYLAIKDMGFYKQKHVFMSKGFFLIIPGSARSAPERIVFSWNRTFSFGKGPNGRGPGMDHRLVFLLKTPRFLSIKYLFSGQKFGLKMESVSNANKKEGSNDKDKNV
jgi:hypothetical protein